MTSTFELDPGIGQDELASQVSRSKVISFEVTTTRTHTHTQTHTRPTAVPGPLRWSVNITSHLTYDVHITIKR